MAANTTDLLVDRLRDDLTAFDGRAVTLLSEAAARHACAPNYLDGLIILVGDDIARVAVGATWMIKNHLDEGGHLLAPQTPALIAKCGRLTDWAAQLHLCQSIQYLQIDPKDAHSLADWLMPLLTHRRPFLRAWSMDALCHVAQKHSDLAAKALDAQAKAATDPAASVRARARNVNLPAIGEIS